MKVEGASNGQGEPTVTRVTFRLSARLAHRSLAIDLVSTLVEHVSTADRAFRNAITTAFGEAFNNVVIHAYKNRSDGMLDVEAELGSDHMTLKLMDSGVEANFSTVTPPDLESMPEGGLGVFMINSLVDEVVYRGGTPNVLSLTKRTSAATNRATSPASSPAPAPAPLTERSVDPSRESAPK